MAQPIRVLVWNENVHERKNPDVAQIYPKGMHACIAGALKTDNAVAGAAYAGPRSAPKALEPATTLEVSTATLDAPEHGLSQKAHEETDVLVWWGHAAHGKVAESIVEHVLARIWQGMGFIALHSSHYSKIFKRL